MPTRRKPRRKNRRKTKKNKHSCKCRNKYCGVKRGGKKIKRCKECIKKKCKCLNNKRYRRSLKKSKSRKKMKKMKKYKQRGCAKQRGGALNNNFSCNNALNMGKIITGKAQNKYDFDLNSKSTQSYIPGVGGGNAQRGGGLSQSAINFGLGQGVSLFRSAQNTMANLGRTWNGDHNVQSSDVTVESNRM